MRQLPHYPLIREDVSPEVVILADGNFPEHPLPLALLKQAKHVVCCDGAANEYISRGFTPNIIVGDGDSLSAENKTKYADIIYYSSDTETNDLTKAVDYCVAHRKTDIIILGATGKREDHTIGNIGLLVEYMDKANVQMVTDYGLFTPAKSDAIYESYKGQSVSVFNFKSNAVRGRGLVYTLIAITNWWEGTLNVASSKAFTILARGKILVYRAH